MKAFLTSFIQENSALIATLGTAILAAFVRKYGRGKLVKRIVELEHLLKEVKDESKKKK